MTSLARERFVKDSFRANKDTAKTNLLIRLSDLVSHLNPHTRKSHLLHKTKVQSHEKWITDTTKANQS